MSRQSNAAVVNFEGYGKCLAYNKPSEQVLKSIRELLEDKKIHPKVGNMKKSAEELNAASAIKKLLESNNQISQKV